MDVRKAGNSISSKLLIALIAVAMVFTMMPLSMGTAYAEETTDPAVFSVTGDDLVTSLSYDSIKTLKNDENIKPLILSDVVFHTKNSSGTEEDYTVTGVTIESLINLAGLKEDMELESVTATANDGYSKTYTADQILKADLQGNKAMFIWDENGNKVQKTAVGQFTEGESNRGLWVSGNTITLTIKAKAKEVPAVFSVTGDDLVTPLSYDSIKTLKNDENIKQLILSNVTFHTMNKSGTEEDFTVTGVTIENLINLAGLKENMELESVTATANDGFSKTYTADQILNADLQGNKAMFIWDENGNKVQKTAIGQFAEGEQNRGLWVGGDTITLTIKAKAKEVPAVFSVTGDDLVTPLKYDTIKTLKNDENIKPLILSNVTFHTVNKSGTEEDFTVTGVTIENLINLAGLKENMELESVTATANDGFSKTYTADQILNADLQGNKAMFIWDENGNKVQKTAIGQFAEGEQNRGLWVGGDTITLTVVAKAKEEPQPQPVVKKVNTMKVTAPKSKTYKVKALKKSAKTFTGVTVTKAKGTVSYTVSWGSAKAKKVLKFNKKTKKVTVKKGTKRGTYKITIKVKAAGNKNFKAKTVKKTITVKVTK